jgi:endonuclease YncB( thermonuclease family)
VVFAFPSTKMKLITTLIGIVLATALGSASAEPFQFELNGQVAHIDDGDTIILHPSGEIIRLAEIDAPEIYHGSGKPGQPYGRTAKAALSAMMPVGSTVKAQCYERDVHNRAVCRVFFENIDISLEMVRLGHAHAYKEYVRDPRILGVADYAKATQKGLWASGEAVYPQTWRRECWSDGNKPLYCSNADNPETEVVGVPIASPQSHTSTSPLSGLTSSSNPLAMVTQVSRQAWQTLRSIQLP